MLINCKLNRRNTQDSVRSDAYLSWAVSLSLSEAWVASCFGGCERHPLAGHAQDDVQGKMACLFAA